MEKDILEKLARIELDNDTNLWSYITNIGTYALTFKWSDSRSKNTAMQKRILLDLTSKHFKPGLDSIVNHLKEVKEALLANGYSIKLCRIRSLGRVIIGTGEAFGKVPLEVGLFFDPVLNVPFLPGSSLKGAFRHALEELIYQDRASKNDENTMEIASNDKNVMDINAMEIASEVASIVFGSNEFVGLVGVTDAYPVKLGINNLLFEPDVVTPHYPGASTELDVSPNPVQFLTISRDVEFEFYIYFNKRIYEKEHEHSKRPSRNYAKLGDVSELGKAEHMSSVKDYINYAIHNGDLAEEVKKYGVQNLASLLPWVDRAVLYAFAKGVGAKTSVGYSRFAVIEYKSPELGGSRGVT